MYDRPGLDDPYWIHIVAEKLQTYIPVVREWWVQLESFAPEETGVTETGVAGLYIRMTRVAARSPIKGIQCFPFVPTARLQLTGIQGGSTKVVERVCMNDKLKIDEFTIVYHRGAPSTLNSANYVAFIPTVLRQRGPDGCWLYLTGQELRSIASGIIEDTVRVKAVLKI